MKKLYGVVVPIVTPLTQEDAIDVTSLKRLADHCIDSSMQAIYPCGTTGEMMYLRSAGWWRKQLCGMQLEEYRYLYTWVHGI